MLSKDLQYFWPCNNLDQTDTWAESQKPCGGKTAGSSKSTRFILQVLLCHGETKKTGSGWAQPILLQQPRNQNSPSIDDLNLPDSDD